MSEVLIECKGLTKNYGQTIALDNIDLELESGRIIGLLGPNGSGKTTLLKLLNGLLSPTGGSIAIGGYAPGIESKAMISYLPDKPYFADWMRISDLLDFFSDFYPDFDRQRAEEMCALMDLSTKSKMKSLSKGNKEKVQLILVMSRRAKVYLLDEPIGGVDPAARDYIIKTIINNYSDDACVVISTHLIADVEKILDEAIFIQNGHIVRKALVDDIRDEEGKTLDEVFREQFANAVYSGGSKDVI